MKVADIGDSGSSDVGKRSRATGFFLAALRADNYRSLALTAASIAVAFLSWQAMSTFIFNPFLIPPPLDVIRTAVPMVLSGEIVADVSISMVRVLVGFTTGSLAAIVLGVLLGRLRLLHDLLDPIIELLRYLSPTAMIPIAVIWFGIGEMSKYFLIFWGTFFIVLINTIAGVWRAPIVRHRAADSGIGYLLQKSSMLLQTNRIFVALLTICVLGFAVDRIFRFLVDRTLARFMSFVTVT